MTAPEPHAPVDDHVVISTATRVVDRLRRSAGVGGRSWVVWRALIVDLHRARGGKAAFARRTINAAIAAPLRLEGDDSIRPLLEDLSRATAGYRGQSTPWGRKSHSVGQEILGQGILGQGIQISKITNP